MRVLLINPNREHSPEPVPPIGLSVAAGSAAGAGHQVRLVDLCFARAPYAAVRSAIRAERPDVVGMTVRNLDNADARAPRFYLDELRAVAEVVRAATGASPVLGGAGLTADPARAMAYLDAELGVVGPAERAFPALLRWIETGRRGSPPAGVASRNGPVFQPAAADPAGPPPFAHARLDLWLDLRPYLRRSGAVPVQTRRGCPMRCVYCNYPVIEGRRVVLRSPEDVAAEVEDAAHAGARWVEFCDAVFNMPAEHARRVCDAVARRGAPVRLRSSITPAGLDEGVVARMKEAGFAAALCSPDAAHPDTLASYRKGFGRADLDRAVRLLDAAVIPTLFCFILGGPGETRETLRETLRYAAEEVGPPHAALIATRMRVYPRTSLWAQVRGRGGDDGRRDDDDARGRRPDSRAGAPPLRPEPEAFYLAPGLDPAEVAGAVEEAVRGRAHMQHMDAARSPVAALARRALALFGAGVPLFRVPSLLAGAWRGGRVATRARREGAT